MAQSVVVITGALTDLGEATAKAFAQAQYTDLFNTNVLGTLLSMKHEMRVMQPQGSGAIIDVTSIYGNKGFPNSALYVASKHAIIGLTRSPIPLGRAVRLPDRPDAVPRRRSHGGMRAMIGHPTTPYCAQCYGDTVTQSAGLGRR